MPVHNRKLLLHRREIDKLRAIRMEKGLALVPTKGITLPLVSYGGTSLFIVLASLGVLLNITREVD